VNYDRRQKLLNLGADRLADALLELAGSIDAADDLVERIHMMSACWKSGEIMAGSAASGPNMGSKPMTCRSATW
jgi:hypothetical protein